MLVWINANLSTIIVGLILASICILAIRSMIKKKRSGGSCCGDCSQCGASCPSMQQKK